MHFSVQTLTFRAFHIQYTASKNAMQKYTISINKYTIVIKESLGVESRGLDDWLFDALQHYLLRHISRHWAFGCSTPFF